MNKTNIYVIDTSYLLELFKIPKHHQEESYKKIKCKFESALSIRCRLIVPFPCIFELANHIAHIENGAERQRLADRLYMTVQTSLETSTPWIIPPHSGIEDVLIEISKLFVEKYVGSQIGLTDTYIIREALNWKSKNNNPTYKVHIWTMDKSMKAYEPDHEHDAYLG